jgi:tRNA(Ile)-lysidine synthetase-like protein
MFRSIKNKDYFYVLGVSGGPDSMFLLDKMRKLKYNLIVAHVNYKKRSDSDFDEKVVHDYCRKFKIKFFSFHPKSYEKGNFQSLARKIRYDFFFSIANKFATKRIVIAHNFEDLLETYQLQLKRNSFVNH